ncbi:MAG: sortase [Lachnospiraceae bacterium]|nr:sortase [Lachnospiraceae bacterium]
MNGKHGRLFLITIITAVILCGCTGKKAVNEMSTASQDPGSEQAADSTQAPGREQAADPSHASGTVQGTGSEQAPLDAEFNIVYMQISQTEAMRMMEEEDNVLILDVRTPDEYNSGHIKDAVCLPNEEISGTEPSDAVREILPDMDQTILVYCRSGRRSKEAADKLGRMGYTNIYEFGGINDWKGEIVTGQPAEPLEKYRELLQINPYVAGWLKIDDTVIDVPVVYTPGSQNYFLHRAIDGSESSSGTLFIAINWQEGFNNTLIYGHNMKDGTAFGSLSKFKKESYGRSHHTIHFDTLYEEREYELYGVFYSQIDEDELETEEDRSEADAQINEAAIEEKAEEGQIVEPEELTLNDIDLWEDFGDLDIWRPEKDNDRGRFRYYYYNDLSDRDDWEYFARNVKERSVYDMGIDAEWGDEFVTLSTCSYHVHNGRFVVVGIRKAK